MRSRIGEVTLTVVFLYNCSLLGPVKKKRPVAHACSHVRVHQIVLFISTILDVYHCVVLCCLPLCCVCSVEHAVVLCGWVVLAHCVMLLGCALCELYGNCHVVPVCLTCYTPLLCVAKLAKSEAHLKDELQSFEAAHTKATQEVSRLSAELKMCKCEKEEAAEEHGEGGEAYVYVE